MSQVVINTTTVGGYVWHNDETNTKTWHEIVTGAGNNHHDSGQTAVVLLWCSLSGSKYRACYRGIFCFNTSAIGVGSTVTSATLKIMGTNKSDPGSWAPNVCLYAVTPASTSELANGDYALFGNTPLSNAIAYANWASEDWNTFTLNAAGLAYIEVNGITSIGIRNANYDVADELDPGNHDFTWASNRDAYLTYYKATESGKEPIFTIDYTETPSVTGSGAYHSKRAAQQGGI